MLPVMSSMADELRNVIKIMFIRIVLDKNEHI